MKTKIHPQYHQIKITCSNCRHQIEVGSTLKSDTKIDICSNCHPFFTGSKTYSSSASRVERFRRQMAQKKKISTNNSKGSKS